MQFLLFNSKRIPTGGCSMINSVDTAPIIYFFVRFIFAGSLVSSTATSADKQICQCVFSAILAKFGQSFSGFLSLVGASCYLQLNKIECLPIYNSRMIVAYQITGKFPVILKYLFGNAISPVCLLVKNITDILFVFQHIADDASLPHTVPPRRFEAVALKVLL